MTTSTMADLILFAMVFGGLIVLPVLQALWNRFANGGRPDYYEGPLTYLDLDDEGNLQPWVRQEDGRNGCHGRAPVGAQ